MKTRTSPVSLALCAFLFFSNSSNGSDDLRSVLETYNIGPECIFNYTEINKTTIKHFPKCDIVYGTVIINSNTNLKFPQLQTAFSKMKSLYGGIRIENTNFISLSFLTTSPSFNLYCETYGFFINNNSFLNDASVLPNIQMFPDNNSEECDFRVENNPLLDMESMCNKGYLNQLTGIKTKGNLKDCGCQGDQITSDTLPQYKKCTMLYNGLKLHNLSDPIDYSALENIESILGGIDIQNTTVENVSFLSNLKMLKVRTDGKVVINFKNNQQMTRVPFPLLKDIVNIQSEGTILVNVENLHPDFCLSVEEIIYIFDAGLVFSNLHAKVCEDYGNTGESVVCRFNSMEELPNNCVVVLGNIIVESGDEVHFSKFMYLQFLIGSLTIRNTTLESLEYLVQLQHILVLDESSQVLEITSNKKLTEAMLNWDVHIITRGKQRNAIIQDNNKGMFDWAEGVCMLIPDWYNDSKWRARANLNYIGGDCGERVEIKSPDKQDSSGAERVSLLIFWILILRFL